LSYSCCPTFALINTETTQAGVVSDVSWQDFQTILENDAAKDAKDELNREEDHMASSRFQDNSELQYSLRSIEKNAPWVGCSP
jgi:hypothetical protein